MASTHSELLRARGGASDMSRTGASFASATGASDFSGFLAVEVFDG